VTTDETAALDDLTSQLEELNRVGAALSAERNHVPPCWSSF